MVEDVLIDVDESNQFLFLCIFFLKNFGQFILLGHLF